MDKINFNKMNEKQAKSLGIILLVVAIIFVGGYLIIQTYGSLSNFFSSIFGKIGLGAPDAETTSATATVASSDMQSSNPNSPFSPNLYNNNPDASTLDFATLQSLCTQIYNSVGFFSNTPDSALAAIRNCQNQIDVSNLSIQFNNQYSRDLYDYMSGNFTNTQGVEIMAQIITYVKNLPAS
jgi:hypothetical protein